MAILPRLLALFPLVLSIASAILAALALFAGHKEGFMEDYAIARLNTSGIGQNMFGPDGDSNNDDDDDDDDGIIGSIEDGWDDVKGKVEDELNDITGNIADELARDLGVAEWYSVHVMDICEGWYKPSATAHNPGLNVTNCTNSDPDNRFNLTKMIDHELSVGPFDISLAEINWPSSIQDKLDIVNDALLALFVLYAIGIGLGGLGALLSIAAVLLAPRRSIVLVNLSLAFLAAVAMVVGSIVVTVAVTKGIDELNDVAEEVGVRASKGTKFLVLTWVAAGLMMVATGVWAVQFCVVWRERRREKRRIGKGAM